MSLIDSSTSYHHRQDEAISPESNLPMHNNADCDIQYIKLYPTLAALEEFIALADRILTSGELESIISYEGNIRLKHRNQRKNNKNDNYRSNGNRDRFEHNTTSVSTQLRRTSTLNIDMNKPRPMTMNKVHRFTSEPRIVEEERDHSHGIAPLPQRGRSGHHFIPPTFRVSDSFGDTASCQDGLYPGAFFDEKERMGSNKTMIQRRRVSNFYSQDGTYDEKKHIMEQLQDRIEVDQNEKSGVDPYSHIDTMSLPAVESGNKHHFNKGLNPLSVQRRHSYKQGIWPQKNHVLATSEGLMDDEFSKSKQRKDEFMDGEDSDQYHHGRSIQKNLKTLMNSFQSNCLSSSSSEESNVTEIKTRKTSKKRFGRDEQIASFIALQEELFDSSSYSSDKSSESRLSSLKNTVKGKLRSTGLRRKKGVLRADTMSLPDMSHKVPASFPKRTSSKSRPFKTNNGPGRFPSDKNRFLIGSDSYDSNDDLFIKCMGCLRILQTNVAASIVCCPVCRVATPIDQASC